MDIESDIEHNHSFSFNIILHCEWKLDKIEADISVQISEVFCSEINCVGKNGELEKYDCSRLNARVDAQSSSGRAVRWSLLLSLDFSEDSQPATQSNDLLIFELKIPGTGQRSEFHSINSWNNQQVFADSKVTFSNNVDKYGPSFDTNESLNDPWLLLERLTMLEHTFSFFPPCNCVFRKVCDKIHNNE